MSRKEMPKRVDAYIRVSAVRDRDGDSFTSPDDQERRIRAWAESQKNTTIDTAWRELDVSGGSMDRPMLNQVLERIEQDEIDGLVVFSLDRFGRTLIGALEIIERLHQDGKVFASVSDGFDLNTDTGRLVLRIMLSLAQFERDRIQTRWRDIKADRVLEKGWHISRWVPLGYSRAPLLNSDGSQQTKGKGRLAFGGLVPDPETAAIVTELFERRAAGEEYSSLSDWMRSTGAVASRGSSVWSLSSVRSLINNRVYLGEARGGVKGTRANPDAHQPLTDEATWLAANQVRPPRRAPAIRGSTRPAIGIGLVRCADCRYTVAVQPQAGTADAYNYICDRPWRGKDCPKPATMAAAVRPNGSPSIDDVIAEEVIARLDAEPAGYRKVDTGIDVAGLEDELAHARVRAQQAGEDFDLEERIGTLAWEARCAKLDRLARELTDQLADLRRSQATELSLGRSARDMADDWRAGRLSIDEKREVVAGLVQTIFLRKSEDGHRFKGRINSPEKRAAYMEALRGRVHVVWVGDDEVEVPRQGHGYTAKPFEFPGG